MTQKLDRRTMLQQATALVAGAAAGIGTLQTQPQKDGVAAYLFPGFKVSKVQTSGALIHVVSGGNGPPLLLIHGAPHTHLSWRLVAGAG